MSYAKRRAKGETPDEAAGLIDRVSDTSLLIHRMELEKRIRNNILRLLLTDLEKLPASVILQLQRDLEEWSG